MNEANVTYRWRQWIPLSLILLVAAGLRLHRLSEIPPGLTHDEADIGHFALNVLNGVRRDIDSPYGYIHEPLVHYTGAAFMLAFGRSDFALRAHSVFWGLAAVAGAYLWVRRAFNSCTAWLTAGLLAVSYWPVAFSRQALNFMPVPALFAAGTYCLWRALFEPRLNRRWPAWGGMVACVAAAFYSYESARAAFLALPAFWCFLWIARTVDRRRLAEFGLAIGAVLMLAAPHLLDPEAWGRTNTLAEPLRAMLGGD